MSRSADHARRDPAVQAFPPATPVATDAARGNRSPAADSTPDTPLSRGVDLEQSAVENLLQRTARLERRLRLQLVAILVLLAGAGWLALDALNVDDIVVQRRIMESRELTLLDNDGNPRMFLRMYSKVPVLQLLDDSGRPRMSMGLRFDDTPFLDLSDAKGRTRASLEMTEDDTPALRLYDEHGAPTFNIN